MKKKIQLLKDGIYSGFFSGLLSGALLGLQLGLAAVIDDFLKGKPLEDAIFVHTPFAIFIFGIPLALIGSVFGLIYSLITSKSLYDDNAYKRKTSIEWGIAWVTLGIVFVTVLIATTESKPDQPSETELAVFILASLMILFFGGYIGGKIFRNRRLFPSKKV